MSVSANTQPAVSTELLDILAGSAGYHERIKALQEAKTAADAALAELRLAQGASAALAEAKRMQASAARVLAAVQRKEAKFKRKIRALQAEIEAAER
jgi:hypothetical protein